MKLQTGVIQCAKDCFSISRIQSLTLINTWLERAASLRYEMLSWVYGQTLRSRISLVLLGQDRYFDVFVFVKIPFPLMEFDMHTSFSDRRTLIVNMLGSPATRGSIYKYLI